MVPRSLRLPLTAIQFATVATLMRSVALDRWITVAACLLLLAGASAAVRGRTWGVALSFLIGVTFISICGLGIAPPWFALVGLLAIRPFTRMFRHFLRFDWRAAAMLASGATMLGAAGAVAWKTYAFDLFNAVPMLVPTMYPHHAVAVTAIGVAAVIGLFRQRRATETAATTTTTESRARIATTASETTLEEEELFDEVDEPSRVARHS